jgi:hypothetical protein
MVAERYVSNAEVAARGYYAVRVGESSSGPLGVQLGTEEGGIAVGWSDRAAGSVRFNDAWMSGQLCLRVLLDDVRTVLKTPGC